MNAGKDVYSLMCEVELPPGLRVGQGYGKVEWGVRTIWESYTGWFQRSSTAELYPCDPADATRELAQLLGAERCVEAARAKLAAGETPTAIRLLEAALAVEPEDRSAARLMLDAHRSLLDAGGDVSFWENGWLEHQLAHWQKVVDGLDS
jgi:alkyl sulfatase BDS1-like metallo-beta-lactamase superfamily hydrolase